MKWLLAALLSLVVAATARAESTGQDFALIARGRYLATAGDCISCHTAPGGKPYAGGHELETPFGTLIGPNLTPDRETGIGTWSDDQFVAALQEGTGPHGHLYPAMPYPYYTRITRDDALAIRAYLATLEPVHNPVVANQLPFPFNIRASMAAWNALFFTSGRFEPDASKSDEWNRGAYLVEGLGHCGACHTPKNMLGADRSSRALQGGLLQNWFSPSLKQDGRKGLGTWSVDDVVSYLKTGHNRMSSATGPMAEVVTNSTSQMTMADLRAIAVYLKDLPASGESPAAREAPDDRVMRAGKAAYIDQCAACHVSTGSGVAQLFPTLKGSPTVQSADPTSLIRVVLEGAQSVATDGAPTGPAMPAFGWKLSDDEIAAILTYVRNSWGNAAPSVSADDVKKLRGELSSAGTR
jgi:mono/diheme cytochrome c family protein